MYKKYIIITIVNIIIVLFFIFIINFIIFFNEKNNTTNNKFQIVKDYYYFLIRDISYNDTYSNLISSENFRPIENKDSKEAPIILFGCSNTWGLHLNENETFSYQLGKLTNHPIYNRAQCGWGVQHMFFQLNNEDFYKLISIPNKNSITPYIIYVFFDGHYSRMTSPTTLSYPNCYSIFYKKKNNKFIPKKRNFISDKIIIQHYINNHIQWSSFNKLDFYQRQKTDLIIDYIIQSQKEAKKHWGNVNFVVFFYSNIFYGDQTIKKLNDAGIITITDKDTKINSEDKKYKSSDEHATALYWEHVTPIIIDKLNLNKK